MGLVAEYEITCQALPLVEVVTRVPDVSLEVEMRPNECGYRLFIVHASGGTAGAIEDAFEATTFVGEYTLVGQAGETRRYAIHPGVGMETQLGEAIDDLDGLRALAETPSSIDWIRVTSTGWAQRGWFANGETLEAFRSFWQEHGDFTLRQLTRDGEGAAPGNGLTDPQYEALRAAYELGYFEIPRRASLEDVAAELEISASSLSERLRRAQTRLLETAVASTWPSLPE